MTVRTEQDFLELGGLRVHFYRTLRIPDDGREYPLPPGLGAFPVRRVHDYEDRVPDSWKERGGVFIPMYQREALWMAFHPSDPQAVQVGIGKIDALTGEAWSEKLTAKPQNYLVAPGQPWLDGINSGDGYIRQFVAMPLGMGYTVEGQLTGKEEFGGIQLKTFPMTPAALKEYQEQQSGLIHHDYMMEPVAAMAVSPAMGLGAGGKMTQSIYPDPHGLSVWDQERSERVFVHIANSMVWRDITDEEPPPTPVSAELYTQHGFPWFKLYDEDLGDIEPGKKFGGVKTVKEKDKEKGFGSQQDDEPVDIPTGQTKELGDPTKVNDGKW